MRRSRKSMAVVNRRRTNRRRRVLTAIGRNTRARTRLSVYGVLLSANRYRTACMAMFGRLSGAAGRHYAVARLAAISAGRQILAAALRVRGIAAGFCGRCLVQARATIFRLIQATRSLRDRVAAAIGRGWVAANREIEFPVARFKPYLRAAAGLLAVAAVSLGGFMARDMLRDKSAPAEVSFAELRDHHPPVAEFAALPVLAPDADSEFVMLPGGPEGDPALPMGALDSGSEELDPVDGGEVVYDDFPEDPAADAPDVENLETAMAVLSPRARPRPDIPSAPAVSGIPMQPEAPFGTPPAAQPAWLANAVQPTQPGAGPMIAIVIDDAGIAQQRTKRASELPAPITIAFIPYSDDLEAQTRYARARGHELLLHIPMEPGNSAINDPGRNALLTSLGQDEVMRRFRWALEQFDGYVGVNNHMGSKFMAQPDYVRPVLAEIDARGLLFLDSRTDANTVGTKLAREMGMPNAARNVFLDNDLDAGKIAAQLAQVERVARKRGNAIAIGHPHDVTIDVLARWIPEARRKGFRLVAVSAIVKKEYETQLASAAAGREAHGLLGGAQ